MIERIIVKKKGVDDVFRIYNLEVPYRLPVSYSFRRGGLLDLYGIFCNQETEEIVYEMPKDDFIEKMYHSGFIDPAQEPIIIACRAAGVKVEAAKISDRYYGEVAKGVIVNKLVHAVYTEEPVLETLKPRGNRKGMQSFDLTAMSAEELADLSKQRKINFSFVQMQRLAEIQKELGLSQVTDVFLEAFAARWSDHCNHNTWKALGLFKILKEATEKIGNINLVSAFKDNAGGWLFYDDHVLVFKLETHNGPTQMEAFGGQLTKLGGVLRDVMQFGLNAFPIGNLEMTTVGEFNPRKYPGLDKYTLSAKIIAQETIRAVAGYGNPMGVPMLLAHMNEQPDFGGKAFALGGSVGITTLDKSEKGKPRAGDLAVLVGGRTGNDGIHGATASSGAADADGCPVQIGDPYVEQKMMRAGKEISKRGCASMLNDFGAAGIVSAFGEMGEDTGKHGGILINLASVLLKCAGLENWQIALSESQERFAFAIKPEKLSEAMEIFARYGLEATVVGVFTDTGRFQLVYDPELKSFSADTPVSGEIALDVSYEAFKDCPLPQLEIIAPPKKDKNLPLPEITLENLEEMALRVVGHFDCCNQSVATTQYDSTVGGRTYWGPLYGKNYNISSRLAVLKPIYGKPYGATLSQSFAPDQFAANPRQAAKNAMLDAIVAQVVSGVQRTDICLADNFYTPNKDPHVYYWLTEQVKAIADLSVELGTPFITGKDSSSGSAERGEYLIHVPPSVCITAMGKIGNVDRLVPPQWQSPGNLLCVIGPRVQSFGGSILASSFGFEGDLEEIDFSGIKKYLDDLSTVVASGFIKSAVPISRGGIILRLFEGIEASGFGVKTSLTLKKLKELFFEHFGAVLVEVEEGSRSQLEDIFGELITPIGKIVPEKSLTVQNKQLGWNKLYEIWNKKFGKEVYGS